MTVNTSLFWKRGFPIYLLLGNQSESTSDWIIFDFINRDQSLKCLWYWIIFASIDHIMVISILNWLLLTEDSDGGVGGVFSYFVSWSSTGRLMSAWLSLPALLCTAILALLVSVMDELSFNVCQIIDKYYYNYYSLLCNKPKTSRNSQIYIKSISNNRHQAEALPYKMMLP